MIGAAGALMAGSVIAAATALVLSFSYDFAGGDAWAGLAGAIVLLPITVGAMSIVPGWGCWWWLRRGGVPDARLTGVRTAVLRSTGRSSSGQPSVGSLLASLDGDEWDPTSRTSWTPCAVR